MTKVVFSDLNRVLSVVFHRILSDGCCKNILRMLEDGFSRAAPSLMVHGLRSKQNVLKNLALPNNRFYIHPLGGYAIQRVGV